MAEMELQPATEFQALPLEFIITAPLTAAIKAQAAAAEATKSFINNLITEDPATKKKSPMTVEFNVTYTDEGKPKSAQINAPLLSLVPVPHLRIDSLTVHFKYEISQVRMDKSQRDLGIDLAAQSGVLLSPWVSATLKGSVSSKSAQESTVNRSGVLEITVHASEAPMPEGLAKILTLLAKAAEPKIVP